MPPEPTTTEVLIQLLRESRVEAERMARLEVKIDTIAGLEHRVAALEKDRSKAIGWAIGVSAAVASGIWILALVKDAL